MPPSSACTRSDCQSTAKEVQLLTAELEELEAENEELHEALDTLKKNNSVSSTSREKPIVGNKHHALEMDGLRDELNHLRGKLRDSENETKRIESLSKESVQEVERLTVENRSLQEEMEEKNRLLAKEVRLAKQAGKDADEISKDRKGKREELLNVLRENEELQEELHKVKETLEKVSSVALEYEATIQVKSQQVDDLQDSLNDFKSELTEMEAQVNKGEEEKKMLQEKLLEMDEAESAVDALIQEHQQKFEKEKQSMQLFLEKERSRVSELEKALQVAKEAAGVGGLEDKLEGLEELRRNDRSVIEELKQQLEQREIDLESLVEQHVNIKGVVETAVTDALDGEKRLRLDLKTEIKTLKDRLKDQRSMMTELEQRHATLEGDLSEAEAWKAQYESGAGLEEAVRYQKKLKADLKRRDDDNMKLRQRLNEQLEACGKLNASCQRLKAELGKPSDFEYDDLELEEHTKGEAAAANAVIRQLEGQMEDLEEERVRLLTSLRQNAKQLAASGFKNFGLSTDQVILVTEFVENVKAGKADLRPTPITQRGRALQEEVERLKLELVSAISRADTLEEQLTGKAPVKKDSTGSPSVPPLENKVIEELRSSMRTLTEMQTKMMYQQQEADRVKGTEPMSSSPANIITSPEAKTPKLILSPTNNNERVPPTSSPSSSPSALQPESLSGATSHEAQQPLETTTVVLQQQAAPEPAPAIVYAPREYEVSAEAIAQATAAAVTDALTSAQRTMLPVFETAGEVDEAAQVHFKLKTCIEELATRESDIAKLESTIRKYESAMQTIQDQHTLLYRDFVDRENKKDIHNANLRNELKEMTEKCQDYRVRSARLDELCVLLETKDSDDENTTTKYQNEIRDLTRKLAIFEVNECRLARKYNLVCEEASSEKLRRESLELEAIEMEKVLKLRIKYLEGWKDRAEKEIERSQLALDKSVPKSDVDSLHRELLELRDALAIVLSREAQVRTEWAITRDLPMTVHKLETQVELLTADLEKTKLILNNEGSDKTSTDHQLQVELQTATAKSKVLEGRIKELQDELVSQAARREDLEERSMDAQNEMIASREKSRLVLEQYKEGSTANETKILRGRIDELEKMYEELSRDVQKHKDLSDIAVSQLQAFSQRREIQEVELRTLKEQLVEMESRTDDDSIIGKLQQKLMSIKANYQSFAHKYENAATALRRKELEVRQLETKVDDHEKTIVALREEKREQVETLEKAMWQLQHEFGSTGGSTGRISLSQLRAMSNKVDDLSERLRKAGAERIEFEKQLGSANETVECLRLHLAKYGEADIDPTSNTAAGGVRKLQLSNAKVISQMKQIEALETRERTLQDRLDEAKILASSRSSNSNPSTPEELVSQLQHTQEKVVQLLKQVSETNAAKRKLETELEDMKMNLERRTSQVELLEQQQQLQQNIISDDASRGGTNNSRVRYYEEDQQQLQNAAQVTISSLKSLLAEKNRMVDDYKAKYQGLLKTASLERKADQAKIEGLNDKLFHENQDSIQQLRSALDKFDEGATNGDSSSTLQQELMDQLKEAHALISDHDEQIRELQYKLKASQNERDTAEVRAGQALEDVMKYKEQVVTLEDELSAMRNDTRLDDLIKKLRAQLKDKEKRLGELRTAVIKLKEEFLKAEERHATEIAKEEGRVADQNDAESIELRAKVAQMNAKVDLLQEKLSQSADELKSVKASKKRGGNREVKELQLQLVESQDREQQLKKKLQKQMQQNASAFASTTNESRANELEKRVKILQAQNAALRDAAPSDNNNNNRPRESDGMSHKVWEQEKRLQRRIEILSSRLDEKTKEVETSQAQYQQARETLARIQRERDSLQKDAAKYKSTHSTSSSRLRNDISPNTVKELEQLREQVFTLEEQNVALRRTHQVDHASQVSSLEFERDAEKRRVKELEEKIGDLKERRVKGNDTLRESEERFQRDESIRHDLNEAQLQIRNLGEDLLNRDNDLIQAKFDLEAAELRNEKLRRRLRELKQISSSSSKSSKSSGGDQQSRYNREKELENVVESLKRVVEKLRTENERLRINTPSTSKVVEQGKRVKELKKKVSALEEELVLSKTKASDKDGMSLKLAQVNESYSQVKRQLRSREEELRKVKQREREYKENRNVRRDDEELRMELEEAREELLRLGKIERRSERLQEEVDKLLERQDYDNGDSASAVKTLKKEVKSIKKHLRTVEDENARLTKELSAFDLDFFEEIEDLKYKYAEAIRENKDLHQRLK